MTGRQVMTGRCVESVEPLYNWGRLARTGVEPTPPLYPYLAALSADAPGIEIQPGTEIHCREALTPLKSGTGTTKGGTHDPRPPARKPS